MSTTRLIATAIIVGSLQPALVPKEACADHCQENAVERLKAFGGRVDLYVSPAQQPSWLEPAKKPSSSDPKTITFFNTMLTDLDLALVTDALLQIENIKRLDLSYTRLEGESLGGLAGIASLTELDLSSTPISATGLMEITLLRRLTSVSLNNTYLPCDSFVCFNSQFAKSLRSLDLSGAKVVDPCLQPLGAGGMLELISRFPRLEHLDLSQTLAVPGSTEETDGVPDLRPLAGLRNLKELNLSNDNLNGSAMPPLAKLTKLTVLNLAGNKNLTTKCLAVLWPPIKDGLGDPLDEGLNNLTKLNLSGIPLTDAGLSAIAARDKQLVDLNISNTYTLVSRDSPASLGQLTNLTRLNIADTGVNDALFRATWKDDKLKKLDSLDISGTAVTDRGLTTDTPNLAVGFPRLGTIYCADTKVTTGGVNRRNALAASLPPPKDVPQAPPPRATPQAPPSAAALEPSAKPSPPWRRFHLIRKDTRMRQ